MVKHHDTDVFNGLGDFVEGWRMFRFWGFDWQLDDQLPVAKREIGGIAEVKRLLDHGEGMGLVFAHTDNLTDVVDAYLDNVIEE